MKQLQTAIVGFLFILSIPAMAQGNDWEPVTGEDNLRQFVSGKTFEREFSNGEISRGEYHADGTGVVYEYGGTFPRTWAVKGDNQVCITADKVLCYVYEKSTITPGLYRGREISSDQWVEFRSKDGHAIATGKPDKVDLKGSAVTASAAEIAAELANPNTPLATLTLKYQFRSFEGSLPNANNQHSSTMLLQPSLPFPLDDGGLILFRPAIPLLLDQPAFNSAEQGFDSKFGLGDIAFDLAYARTSDTGLLTAAGIISSLPTATGGLGSKRFTLGPEVMIGKMSKNYVVGAFPNHQWDIGGPGDADISLTTLQFFGIYLPGGGWNVGSTPIINYDHIGNEWTIPLNLTIGKTVIMGGKPWKLGMEINYYVEQPDAFGPRWMIGFNIGPVVKNVMADWFK